MAGNEKESVDFSTPEGFARGKGALGSGLKRAADTLENYFADRKRFFTESVGDLKPLKGETQDTVIKTLRLISGQTEQADTPAALIEVFKGTQDGSTRRGTVRFALRLIELIKDNDTTVPDKADTLDTVSKGQLTAVHSELGFGAAMLNNILPDEVVFQNTSALGRSGISVNRSMGDTMFGLLRRQGITHMADGSKLTAENVRNILNGGRDRGVIPRA